MASRADRVVVRVVVVAVVAGRRPVRWRRAAAGESAHSSRAPSSRAHVVGSRFGGGLPVRRSGGRAPVRWSSSRLTTSRALDGPRCPTTSTRAVRAGGGHPLVMAHSAGNPVGAARLGSGVPEPGRPVGVDGPCSSIAEDDGFVVRRRRGTAGLRRRCAVPVGCGRCCWNQSDWGGRPHGWSPLFPLREYEGDPDPLRVGLADPPDRLDAPVGRPLADPASGARPRDELLVPDDLDGLAPVPVPVLRGGRDPVAPWPLRAPVPRG